MRGAFTEPSQLVSSLSPRPCLPPPASVRVPPPVSPPALCRCVPFACIYKVAGANGCSLDEPRPSCRTRRPQCAPVRQERGSNFFLLSTTNLLLQKLFKPQMHTISIQKENKIKKIKVSQAFHKKGLPFFYLSLPKHNPV